MLFKYQSGGVLCKYHASTHYLVVLDLHSFQKVYVYLYLGAVVFRSSEAGLEDNNPEPLAFNQNFPKYEAYKLNGLLSLLKLIRTCLSIMIEAKR